MIKTYWKKGGKQKAVVIFLSILVLAALFFFRDDYQPGLLFIRRYIFPILLSLLVLFFGLRKFRKTVSSGGRFLILGILMVFFVILYLAGWHFKLYDYMRTYNVFNDLNKVQVDDLPLTQNERIQPLRNIFSMANESVGETLDVSLPHLVRVDGQNKWTMAIQPSEKYVMQQLSDNIEEVFSVSSTTPFPRFSNENRIPVTFAIGESLKFSRETYNAVVQRFNPWMLLNYAPGDVFFVKNDSGKWVQIVSLTRYKGFFFPYPTFGGVMVIEQGEHDFNDYLERITIGKGTFISPEEMKNHPYLLGQNTLSEKVSQLQAESLKFLGGFSDPLPWNMQTAVKIPSLADDQNQQPFVTDFDFDNQFGAVNGLYHWFGLEPVGDERTSLSYSVFIPADGTDKLFYYDHASRKQGYAGVSAMPLKVIESRKEFDWSVNKPVEFRPYIKDIAGRKRMFFLGTISAIREGAEGQFDGAATPDLALIDSEYRDVVWIDAKHPSQWDKKLYDQLNEAWRSSEGIGEYFVDEVKPVTDISDINADDAQRIVDSLNAIINQNKKQLEIERLQRELDSLKNISN
jgi:hypothetical protein